ncbi:class I SAM-dependent RNA methyltransferase [Yunchengibacter salinarum]|uniref:class I SAM-dependent RNA methyltransferase n=1 Tax=Yunchengibacter salinarum TaxID=3133399 RepID=UPI0035B5B27A
MSDVTLTVRDLGRDGDGVATLPDGRAVMVFGALPGEQVRAHVVEDGPPARAVVAAITRPAPERVTPPCPHFGPCGGCRLQHADDAMRAAFAERRITDALAAEGLEAPLKPCHLSPPGTRRRVGLVARKQGRNRTAPVAIGYHGRASHDLVDVRRCPLLTPVLEALLPLLRKLLPPLVPPQGRLHLHLTDADGVVAMQVRAPRPLDARGRQRLAAFCAQTPVSHIRWESDGATEDVRDGSDPMIHPGGVAITVPPGAFIQATADGEAALIDGVRAALEIASGEPVLDFHAGLGTFTLPLSRTQPVRAVEGSTTALAALKAAAKGLSGDHYPIKTETRDLERRPSPASAFKGVTGAVFDPPRSGAPALARQLAQAGPDHIAAVSCNPASFARDAASLVAGGYRLAWVQPVAQFVWSPHVELVAALVRA